ncbi:MAG: hypothetical protein JSS07_08805 [Proteobacteria bacterium]|nr:hypothetical protein [Pseudomonadota bacterium]
MTYTHPWYQMGFSMGLGLTSIPKFYLQNILLHIGARKRSKNVVIDTLGLGFYLSVSFPLTLGYISLVLIEQHLIAHLLGLVGQKIGRFLEQSLGLRLKNHSDIISFFTEDLLPRAFTGGWMLGIVLLLGGVPLTQGLLIGAAVYGAYRTILGVKEYVASKRAENTPTHTLKNIADNLFVRQSKFLATKRYFSVLKRFFSKKYHIGFSLENREIYEVLKQYYTALKKDVFVKTDNLGTVLSNEEQLPNLLVNAYVESVKFINENANSQDFATAHTIRWVHGATSASLAGLRKNALRPFGLLIQEFAPYCGELGAGISEKGINQWGLSGIAPSSANIAWESYAKKTTYSGVFSLLNMSVLTIREQMSNIFNAQGEVIEDKGNGYSDFIKLLINIKRVQQWDPTTFKAWLEAKDGVRYWISHKIFKTAPPIQVSYGECLKRLQIYLKNIRNNESFWKDYQACYPNTEEDVLTQIKDRHSALEGILSDILNMKVSPLTLEEKYFVISDIPMLYASTSKTSPFKRSGQLQELVWRCDHLNLGKEIDVIITDTILHKQQIAAFLAKKGIEGVKCMTYASFVASQEILPTFIDETLINQAKFQIADNDLEKTELFAQSQKTWTTLRDKLKNGNTLSLQEIEEMDYHESLSHTMKQAFCNK